LPFKLNDDCCRHIPRQKHRITNSAAYDAALRQRGSLTVWFTDEAIAGWRAAMRTTPGGQPRYSPLAILTALTLRAVFRLALRQTEGLIGSALLQRGRALARGRNRRKIWPERAVRRPKPPSSPEQGFLADAVAPS